MERKQWGYGPGKTPPPGLPEPDPPPEKSPKAKPAPAPVVGTDPKPVVTIAVGQQVRIVNRHRFSLRYPQIPPEVVAQDWEVLAIAGDAATIQSEFYRRECPAHWLGDVGPPSPANQCTYAVHTKPAETLAA